MGQANKNEAVSYLRVSSKGQVHGDGFPRQRSAVAKYAKSNRLAIVAEFRDEGVSGTLPVQEREGFAALVERIASNGVRVVIVEKADRLARDLIESELGLRILRDLGVRVIEAEGGTDLTDGNDNPTAVLIRQVLGAVSEFEKSALVSKLRAARTRKRRETGRCEGVKPYGELAGEAEALAHAKRLRRKSPKTGRRRSYAQIAVKLEAEEHPTRSGKPWTAEIVRGLLRSDRGARLRNTAAPVDAGGAKSRPRTM